METGSCFLFQLHLVYGANEKKGCLLYSQNLLIMTLLSVYFYKHFFSQEAFFLKQIKSLIHVKIAFSLSPIVFIHDCFVSVSEFRNSNY